MQMSESASNPADAAAARATGSDLLVLPRGLLDATAIALLRCPVLLVG